MYLIKFFMLSIYTVLILFSYSFGQIGVIKDIEIEIGNYVKYAKFLGSANMDDDANKELVYAQQSSDGGEIERLYIIDGVTGTIEWNSGDIYSISIAGYNFNEYNHSGSNSGFSPFCDINNDGIKEITFYGQKTGEPKKVYIVGSNNGTIVEGNEPQTINNPNLSQNYPNPFNPTTTINYEITSKGKVKLAIYNINGQLVCELVNKISAPGEYQVTWDGKNIDGTKVSSGPYFYQLQVNDYISTKKALFLK